MLLNKLLILCVITILNNNVKGGILYPQVSSTREQLYLDGLWEFSLNPDKNSKTATVGGLSDDPNDHDIQLMPVPSSYNDIPTTLNARDHVGPVAYERTFLVPNSWGSDKRIWLRFGSVCYSAKVYINDKEALDHEIGHLPFVEEITSLLTEDENSIRVIVDNILTNTSVPQGEITTLPSGRDTVSYTFDFFNYGGIDRPVVLYSTPKIYIDDIDIITTVKGTTGIVDYLVSIKGTNKGVKYNVKVLDSNKTVIATTDKMNGTININNANLWWPYLMDDNPGYLYTLQIEITDSGNNLIDSYSQPFGIRELAWTNTSFTINGKPIYIRGFGRHEDSDIRGKGFDLPLIIRDHNLMRWIGANAYRTSHYPYAEEIMDLADSLGIMIIDEVPAVNTENFNDGLLKNHKKALTELYNRDKNRPSVVIWSIANEPRTNDKASEDYYRQISSHIKTIDKTRPITIANLQVYDVEYSGQFLDILGVNKYSAWYDNPGQLETIVPDVLDLAEGWHKMHNKPVLITEYGADALEGLHELPTFIWSEEFQVKMMSEHFKAFDQLREKGWLVGEMIWNFADFRTANDIRRVGGNKKGMFTRERQPKDSAHFLRKRYWSLANALNNVKLPEDLDDYVIQWSPSPSSSYVFLYQKILLTISTIVVLIIYKL